MHIKYISYKQSLQEYTALLFFLLLAVSVLPGQISAQEIDSVFVPWQGENGAPELNALRNTIISDTLEDGTHRQDVVYVLERGGFYWNSDRIENDGFHLRLHGHLYVAKMVIRTVDQLSYN
mgnify:CR=1 FL=1